MRFHITVWDDDQQCFFNFDAYIDDIVFNRSIYDGNCFDVTDVDGIKYGYPLSALVSMVCVSK